MKKIITAIFSLILVLSVQTANVSLSWEPSVPTNNVIGYRIYSLRTPSGAFAATNVNMINNAIVVGNLTTNVVITNISSGFIRFVATAYDQVGTNIMESDFSNEASTNILNKPSVPTVIKIISVTVTN
jgi:hypothetical protein